MADILILSQAQLDVINRVHARIHKASKRDKQAYVEINGYFMPAKGPHEVKICSKVMREYGISDTEPCAFCGNEETVCFNEHWSFCPECAAIYTTMWFHKGCKHIKKTELVVRSEPWYKDVREKVAYTMDNDPKQRCSVCGKRNKLDGW